MISVVIPLYNKADKIKKTLESVFAQTYTNYEIVIVDDGSTDASASIVEHINDPRIRLIHQKNAGVSAARNKGIQEAHGEYVALLDGDDEWKPEYLATQINLIKNFPECSVFVTGYEFHDQNGRVTYPIINNLKLQTPGELDNYFEIASSSDPIICSINIVAKKNIFESIGGFPVGIKSGEDLLTWARLAVRYKIAYSRKPMAVFNVEGYNIKEKPKRVPAEDDVVGRELMVLAKEYNPAYIRKYISLWHKMRSSVYMRLGMRRKSIREAIIGIRYNPLNYKLYAFCLLNLLPSKFQPF